MGLTREDIDWRVWGKKSTAAPATNDSYKDTIGTGWSYKKKTASEPDEESAKNESSSKNKKITVKLKNGQFITDGSTAYTKECKITVDIEGKTTGMVTFALWARYKKENYDLQYEKKVQDNGQIAQTTLPLLYVEKHYNDINKDGQDPGIEYFAKISTPGANTTESKCLNMPLTQQDNCVIFFAPGRNEYLEIAETEVDALTTHINKVNEISTEISDLHILFEGKGCTDENLKKAQDLEIKVKKKFKDIADRPEKAIQELLVVKNNVKCGNLSQRVYVEPRVFEDGTVKGQWSKLDDANTKEKIRNWYGKQPDKVKEDFKAKMKGVLWKSDGIDTQWPWDWKFSTKDKDADTKAGYFKGSAEAQFFRFVAGVTADTEFDLLKSKKLKLGVHGDVSYSLAEATVTGSWSLPDKDGLDLFDLLKLNDKGVNAVHKGRVCRIRLTIEANGKAFTGGAATASVALPSIDLSSNDKDATWSEKYQKANQRSGYVEAGGEAFAGGSLEGKIAVKGEWRSECIEFSPLALIQAVAAGSGGLAAGANVKFGYQNGMLRLECAATVVVGLGGKAGYVYEIGIDKGFEFIAHLFYSVDYHYIKEVLGEAFNAFRDYSFAQFSKTEKLAGSAAVAAVEEVKDFGTWLNGKIIDTKNEALKEVKSVIRKNILDSRKLRLSPPETLGGQVLKTIMATVEPEDFDAIIKVLENANSDHELKWILRRLVNTTINDDKDGSVLQEGIRKIMQYGSKEEKHTKYLAKVRNVLNSKGIKYE